MKLLMFSVFDDAVKAWNTPIFERTKASAVRAFTQSVNDAKSQLNTHYKDYSLWFLGEYDDNDGSLVCPKVPERVILASECIDDDVFPPEKRLHNM